MTVRLMPLVRRVLVRALAMGTALAALAACVGPDDGPEVTVAAPTIDVAPSEPAVDPEPAASVTQDEYCVVVAPFLQPVERGYVGSDQHVADIAELKELSEPALAEALELLERHYDEDVDPANPDSQNFPNFPEDVKAAALFVDSELRELCGG